MNETPTQLQLGQEKDKIDLGVALALSGGFGRYQKRLVFILLPITTSGVFCANAVTFVLPAIVCHLQISKYGQGLLYSAVYIGMVIGGFVWGMMADTFGRRRTLIIILGCTASLEFLSAFTVSYWSLFFCKVCAGFTNCGILTTFFTYSSEFVDSKNKDTMTMRIGGATAFGYFIQPLIAYFILPLKFKYTIIPNSWYLVPWKVFVMISALIPLTGFMIAIFVLYDSPAFLIRAGRTDEAFKIVRFIYSMNTGKSKESFPAKSLYLKEDEGKVEEEKKLRGNGGIIEGLVNILSQITPLFHYPYFLPASLAFTGQFFTMAAYNSIRSHQTTIFAMALGIGQIKAEHNQSKVERVSFCQLFETQEIFRRNSDCLQETITLNPKIYACSIVIGFSIFLSFFASAPAVNKFGKKCVFLTAHLICAFCISLVPWSCAIFTLILICIFSVCLQNCIAINIGLMIGRVPTSMRGITVSLLMICGRFGVILGSQILPVITNLSCPAGFLSIAFLDLIVIPVIIIFSRQPNPLKEEGLKLLKEIEDGDKLELTSLHRVN